HSGNGCGVDLGDVADEASQRLAGIERREVRSQFEYFAPARLDVGRRGRIVDVSRGGALRRMRARHGRARVARVRAENAQRIHLPGDPLRLFYPGNVDQLSSDGSALSAESEFRYSEHMDD